MTTPDLIKRLRQMIAVADSIYGMADEDVELLEAAVKELEKYQDLKYLSEEAVKKVIVDDFKSVNFDDWSMAERIAKAICSEFVLPKLSKEKLLEICWDFLNTITIFGEGSPNTPHQQVIFKSDLPELADAIINAQNLNGGKVDDKR